MIELLDGFYLCPITGQNAEVLEGKVLCSAIKGAGECEKSKQNLTGCSVYVDANRSYIQSQPRLMPKGPWNDEGKEIYFDGPGGSLPNPNTIEPDSQSQAKCTPVLNTLREILKISRHYP